MLQKAKSMKVVTEEDRQTEKEINEMIPTAFMMMNEITKLTKLHPLSAF